MDGISNNYLLHGYGKSPGNNSLLLNIWKGLLFAFFLSIPHLLAGQTTEQFNSSPTLISHPTVPSWKTSAEVTINGVVYELLNGGNGGWAFSPNGGVSNSSSLWYSTAATTSVTIKRKDGERFQFYGVWLKYTNVNNSTFYPPPFLRVNYNGSGEASETFGINSTVTLSKNVNVTSVTLMFSGLLDLYFDNLIVGPAVASLSTVTTSTPSNVAGTFATLGGNVTSDGGGIITERGVVFSTTTNPTTSNTKITMGTGSGAFSTQVTGLSLTTTYYTRAYSINSAGTSYGDQVTFTTTDGSGPIALYPIMDSAIDDVGSYPNDQSLYIGNDPVYGYGFMEAFMKFSIPVDLSGTVQEAKLRVNVNYVEGTGIFLKAFGSSNDSWLENTSNVPSKDSPLGQTSISATGWIEIDVTSFVQSEFAGDKVVTLVLIGNNSGMSYVGINSREHTNKPELVLTMASGPSLPEVLTSAPDMIGFTGATLSGLISSDGGASITARGFVYSTTDNSPTIGESGVVSISSGSGTGSFSEVINGLESVTTYFVQAYATSSAGTSYGGVESFTTLADDVDPEISVPNNATKNTDEDNCVYLVQGTEFDPISVTDNSGTITSLTYSLQKLLPNPNLVSENFNSGSWDSNNFEIGSASGSVVNGAYRSGGGDDRGTLRTIANFIPSVENPIYVSATLRFNGTAIAFIGTRATGLKNPSGSNEPLNSLYFRIHNFNNGQTNLTSTSFDGRPGNAFYSNPVRVEFVDNGSNITGTFTNTVTNQVLSFNQNTNYSSGSWRVVFSGGGGVSWDDIQISVGPHAYIQEYASGSNSLSDISLGLGETTIFWTAEDNAGNIATESLLVSILDNQNPFLSVSENLAGQSESSVNWETTVPDVVFGDNCSEPQLSWQMSGATSASGLGQVGQRSYAPGITTITYTVTDASGNTATASITVENTKEFFAGGTGTILDPYQIEDWEHLFNIRYFNDNYFILNNDLDNSSSGYNIYASPSANEGIGWLPANYIGNINLDGKGYTIADLNCFRPNHWGNGIFEYLYNSSVKNLILKNFNIEGQSSSGSIAGYAENTLFENVQVINGNIISTEYSGGLLIGGGYAVSILNSSAEGDLSGQYYLGGFSGEFYNGRIENSFADVSISGTESIGGLVGSYYTWGSENFISKSFAKGTISGVRYLGGLVGQAYQSKIINAYSQVDVIGSDNYIGGIVGYGDNILLQNIYSTGEVQGEGEYVGILTGSFFNSSLLQSFWDIQISGEEENIGGGTGLSTSEMKTKTTFTEADWDFESIWIIKVAESDNGYISYPYLKTITYDEVETSVEVNPIPGLELVIFSQIITFPEIETKTYGDESFDLGNEQTDKGLIVVYTAADPSIVNISGNQATILKAGTTTISATQEGDETHFAANPIEHTLTVEKASLTITADNQSKVYGEVNPTLTFTYTGLVNGDTEVSTEPSISTTATASSGVGTYPITLTGGLDSNYEITLAAGELEITKASVTISADNQSKVYGEVNPTLTFTYTGLVNGDEKVATEPSISTTATASSGVGTYPITLTGGLDSNYEITLAAGELEITKASVTISADNQSKVYGEVNPTLTFTYTGLVNGDEKVATEPSISTTATASSGVGTYPITLTGGSDANYEITLAAGELEITKASVTISADNQSKVYGEANPVLTFTYTGLVNGDTEVSTEPSISTTATASSGVGTYPITLTGGSDANYEITLAAGELEITKASVTISADNQSKVYGEVNPTLTFTYTGLVNGDEKVATEPSIATTATASSGVGTYPITLTGGSDANYEITLAAGELEITKASVTISADNQSKVYGEVNPTLTFTYTGLVNGDTEVSTEPSIETTATASSGVGTYPITLTGGSDANYEITLAAGELEITKASVTISADNQSKVYGEANPVLTFTYTGLVNGDTEVSTEPSVATTATASSGVGTYPINLTGGSDANYEITLSAGELEITKASVTISADNQSKVYGEANPVLTFTYTGLVNGDTEVSTEPSIATTATASSGVGTYPITLTGGLDANYEITLAAGELEITKASVTITADNQSKVYGELNPTLTFTYTGLVNGDEKVATEPSIATTATVSSGVGTYPITLTGGSDANYEITLAAGELEITKASVTISADNQNKVYGEANPVLTFTYTGLVNGDEKIATEPSIATTATASSGVGTYPITLTGGSDANYEITLAAGELEITKASVTISADNQSKVYGEVNPTLTFTYTGLVNGDTEVSTEPSISTTATASSGVGTYPITLTGGLDANYEITLAAGELEITKASVTISADNQSKVYGEVNPTLTFTYTGLVNGDEKVATEPSIATTATASSGVGTYPITLTGGSDANYEITLAAGELEITKASVTISADNQSKVYGEANPVLTFTYTGLVNGDEKVATEPSIATTATASSGVGTYPITLTGGSDANYEITLAAGELEITKASVTISADNQSKVYGEVNPTLTFTYTGLVNGDTEVSTEPSIATTATASSGVGTYPIILTGGSDANYEITLAAGELEITRASVTITADNQNKVYGEANPVLTFTYTGLVNGDTEVSTEPSIATTATASSGVGTYPITLTGGSDANYEITLAAGELEITKASVTISADNQSKVYGEANPVLTFTYTGLVNGDEKVATEPSIATTATASSGVGTYPITLTGGLDANYEITLAAGELEITKASVTISADNQSKVYGEVNPVLTFTYTGLVNGDTEVSTEPSISTTATASSGVGTYPITLTGGLDANYEITLAAGELEITKASVTITADNQNKVYGEANPVLTFTYTGLVNGDEKVAAEPSISTTATASSGVGTYPITLTGGSDANYEITLAAGELEITKASVTITADNQSKVYGEENPTLTFTYTGLVNGDTKVSTEPSIATTATASSGVGTYPITLTGGSDANYEITLAAGELEITKASVTISADNQSKVYGEANPVLTFTYTGLVNGDEKVAAEPGIVTTATASSGVGTYPITLTGGSDANYEITLAAGELEITKASVTISADNQSKVYGEVNPTLTFTYTGLVNGDTEVSTEPSIATTATASSGVGTYPITLTGGSDANYEITLAAGELEITKASVTISADNQSKVYGEANPVLTFTYTGLVNGDEKVATEPSIATTATASSGVGTYPITLTGGLDANYEITLAAGELEITKASVTISADNQSKVYGEVNPVLTFTYTGLVNGDTEVSTEPSISTTATASSEVGTYPITLTGGLDANYEITLAAGELEITKASVTITADNQNKVYGEANPVLTFTYTGLVNGDEKVAAEPSISTTATASSGVGTYPITLTGGSDANYEITLAAGELEITKASVTITADNQSKVYGEENPTLTFTYTGLVNGDTKVSTEPSIATTATASSGVGTYPITLTGGSDANYEITLAAGELEITKASVTISADNQSKVYGEVNPTLTFTYTGLVNGDTEVSTEPSIATTATASSGVGTYPITLTGGSDANYEITLAAGELEITKASVTISADNQSKVYGEANPVLTFTYTGLVNGDEKVATEPSIATTATASSGVGTYPITLTGGSDANYEITLAAGELEITKASVTISADNQSKVYGEANPTLTFTYTGLVNGDTEVSTEPSIATTATASSGVGTYPITLTGGSDANYEITLAAGELEITKASVTISADNQSKVYGELNPTLTFTYTGLVNGDEKVATEPSIATTATASSGVGTYPITLTGGLDANYEITLAAGELEITPAQLTVRVNEGQSKIFGTEDPELTFVANGFMADDTLEIISGSLIREQGEAVGTYRILIGSLNAGINYTIEFSSDLFEIMYASLEAIISPEDVETAWNTNPELPATVIIMTVDGRFLEFGVTWDLSNVNLLARGSYTIAGTVALPEGLLNENGLLAEMKLIVLPKPIPSDLILSNNSFEGSTKQFFIHIGGFRVVDDFDHTHIISLAENRSDNQYFEIIDSMLFWSSADQVEGRNSFFVTVWVDDRDGNRLEKVFEIKRIRKSVADIMVYNTFSPNGDGINDTWGIPELRFYRGVTIRVFERNGLEVFITNNPDKGWDGTFKGKEMAVGTYFWTVVVGETGETRRGMLNLIRK
ncbi:MBG domain-containing protein [Mongoliitalea daihaiensis]|uniref:MBG domain-containing protein n=1 Tax=Mongoliitalea daihaiensis TaxID=2782006 RepID=UPI001F165B7C|nr:MBG domain-containing protein [Mongoliitalea daihaiensis]UJP65218.1 gliding motility-associated C-terminal domain-containing protein [Mongoliitalea daihaiensis]